MRTKLASNSPWIATSLVLIALAYGIVALVEDVISQPHVRAEISTITRSTSTRADVVVGPITADTQVGQTFRATEPNLSEVAIMLATYGRKNHVPLVFSLWQDPPGKTPLRTVVAQPESVADNAYHAFQFPPIVDSAGEAFLLTLQSPQGTPDDAFTAWMGNCDCYPEGEAILNGAELHQRDLALRVGYHEEVTSVLRGLVNRLSQYKPWFFKGGFLAFIGLASLSLTLLAVGSFTSSLLNHREGIAQWAWMPPAALVIATVTLWFVLQ